MLGHVCFEFLFLGRLGSGTGIGDNWSRDGFEREEKLAFIQRVYNCFFKGH
jgi:hypothetical protein